MSDKAKGETPEQPKEEKKKKTSIFRDPYVKIEH